MDESMELFVRSGHVTVERSVCQSVIHPSIHPFHCILPVDDIP